MSETKAEGVQVAAEIQFAFGRRLRKARRARNLTQGEFAKRAKTSRPTISNIESGRQSVSLISLYRFADVLSCTVFELIAEDLLPEIEPVEPPHPVEMMREYAEELGGELKFTIRFPQAKKAKRGKK